MVRARAERSWNRLAGDFPGDPESGWLTADARTEQAFLERHRDLPCPALDPASGTCDLYAWRPLNCRSYGPPVRAHGENLPPCRLCFVGSGARVIESCRVVLDPEDVEGGLLADLGRDGERETLVARALLGDRSGKGT